MCWYKDTFFWYTYTMKTKILIIIATLLITIACSPKQITIFKKNIANRHLTLVSFDENVTVPKNVTIRISSKNTFKGFGGCNDYNGTYTLNRDYINFKIIKLGTKVCDSTYQEGIYIRKLVKSKKIVVQGKKIYFESKDDKKLLTFKKTKITPKL